MLDDALHYAGHTYRAEQDDEGVRKLWHTVTRPDGSTISVPFTPYERMTSETFRTFVEMGCPDSTRGLVGGPNTFVNFDNASLAGIRAMAEDNGLALSDLDAIKTVKRLRAQ